MALEKLQENPEYVNELGLRAQQWAKDTFTAENYALKLTEITMATARAKAVTTSINYLAKIMYGWGCYKELLGKEYIVEPLSIFNDIS